MSKRTKLFSVSIADCEVQTFRSGGKGGQHQNTTDSGVRIIHHPSGARGESREHRNQFANKKAAFERMALDPKFKTWVRIQAAKLAGQPSVEEQVEAEMDPRNIKVEYRVEGKWVPGE